MPDITHETTTLDFKDLAAYCATHESADFDQIIDALISRLHTVKHVKHAQASGTMVVVRWSYPLPTIHVARRELKIQEAIEAILAATFSEAPDTEPDNA